MKIIIPKEKTFVVPAGQYRAVLTKVTSLRDGELVRLVFDIITDGDLTYQAGKNYSASLEKGSMLREDLVSWMGRDFTKEELRAGAFDLESKIEDEADLLLTHSKNKGYSQPFVSISKIYPPGTLVTMPEQPLLKPAFG